MKSMLIILVTVLVVLSSLGVAEAAVTASTNFCNIFTTHPECTGWRVKPISDNFWFCEYVDLPSLCKNLPNPQKQIPILNEDDCCRLFDDDLISPRDMSSLYYDESYSQMVKTGSSLPESYPVDELVIWTDKDYYDFNERINVYGKFDFGDAILKKANTSVDVKLNDIVVMSDIPVANNGWFSGFFFFDDPRHHITGINQISVSYFHKPTLENPDKLNTATYQFTTGDIDPPKIFTIKLSTINASSEDNIAYGTEPEKPLPLNMKHTLISRITNPDGVVFPLTPISMFDLGRYMNDISELRNGNYTITMTVGNFTVSESFVYVNP